MTDPDKVKLLGPYPTPPLHRGARVHCLYRDKLVIVTGLSAGRISWPLCKPAEGKGRPGLLVEEVLASAIRRESGLAMMHWWGASSSVVHAWRKALGVERFTPGSRRLQRLNAAAVRGVPLDEEQIERRRRTAIALDLGRHLHPCRLPNGSPPWTEAELALLGTLPDEDLARQPGRSRTAVRIKREQQGIAPPDGQGKWQDVPGAGQPWTTEDDAVVLTLEPQEAAQRLGRTVKAVYNRRRGLPRERGEGAKYTQRGQE